MFGIVCLTEHRECCFLPFWRAHLSARLAVKEYPELIPSVPGAQVRSLNSNVSLHWKVKLIATVAQEHHLEKRRHCSPLPNVCNPVMSAVKANSPLPSESGESGSSFCKVGL